MPYHQERGGVMTEEAMRKRAMFMRNQRAITYAPVFMLESGFCEYCGKYMIDKLLEKGNDGTKLVTGCPLCRASFCD